MHFVDNLVIDFPTAKIIIGVNKTWALIIHWVAGLIIVSIKIYEWFRYTYQAARYVFISFIALSNWD